ncbi:MAG: type I-E CRISPR-associated protein Cse1/CasA [Deltaproteobacteria bacterium]|nr:type I-E CRISPR-associated protein Cse1/CasA [Deltaproteobacteria bacterium]
MNRPFFNVLTEPWIPVIRLDGSRDELGILSCLEQAHELREVRDPAPIIEFGLYRLLVAFVLDALILANRRPEDPLDLKAFMDGDRFDSRLIENYIKECGDVFDLFHPERPFLQTKMDKAKTKPLAGMFPVAPSGTNVNHWHHEHEDDLIVPCQVAVRLLTTIAPFMTAGGAGLSPSINGAPAIYALPMGKNLFETIVLNIPLRNQDSGDGVTAWRSKRSPGEERSQATTVEALTWRPRQIQLVPELGNDTSVSVREMKFEKGDSTGLTWIDAGLGYRYDKDKVTPIRMRENRPLWRDAGPLLLLNELEHGRDKTKVSFRRPDVVEQAFALTDVGERLVIQIYGMRTDMKMKVFEWAKSAWSMPSNLGRSTRLGSLVHRELELADSAARWLRFAILALAPEFEREERKPPGKRKAWDKRSIRNLADRCERAYWQHLEFSFHPLMKAFAALDPNAPDDPSLIATTARDWRKSIRRLAIEQFEVLAEDMDADSDALERRVRARTRLNNNFRKVLL